MRVLIVDTSIAIVQRLKDLISGLDFVSSIDSCLNYTEASVHLRDHHPDGVLLDMALPAKKSFELLSELKNPEPCKGIIALADTASEGIKEKCLALGATYFLDKYSEFEKVPGLLGKIYGDCVQKNEVLGR